jgi:uncharacterized protein (DUF608 family)
MEPKCNRCGCCGGLNRRDFVKIVGAGAAGAVAANFPVMAGPFVATELARLVPPDKKLAPAWVQSLFDRGSRTVYRGAELEKIGMPVGGLCSGQLYLGGDGKLWHWDIFNVPVHTGAGHYANPLQPSSPLEQGFALRVTSDGKSQTRTLDRAGFPQLTFCGEYPIGQIEYRDDALPIAVSLEAFSPFIPLATDDSSLPATVLRFTVKNTGRGKVEAELAGWLENAVGLHSKQQFHGTRVSRIVRGDGLTALVHSLQPSQEPAAPAPRPPLVFADFEGDGYGDWKVEGQAFGTKPSHGPNAGNQHLSGFRGKGVVNSYPGSDQPQGKLTSPAFAIQRPYICFLIGGGNHPGQTCINLVVDGKIVRSSTGKNTDSMTAEYWKVEELAGKTARIEIVDHHSGGWGHIDVDQIEFCDRPSAAEGKLEEQPDFGGLVLGLLNARNDDFAAAVLAAGNPAGSVFVPGKPSDTAQVPLEQSLCGAVSRKLTLDPGQAATVTFVIAWHFPNLKMDRLPGGRHYAERFPSALAVGQYVANRAEALYRQTRLWHDTWYDSTLPYWFLDRTFANASILATSTCHRFAGGRFYGWEGVGCCPGTCTHVWHYAQAPARLFPDLERLLREVDFNQAFDPQTGIIDHRGEFHSGHAIDGQAGSLLRTYREHQMSADDAFLRRNWPKAKRALEYLIERDENADGIIEHGQHNTLDAQWFGISPWLSGLYLSALRAGEAMAIEMGDREFAQRCRAILRVGPQNLDQKTWNDPQQYYVQTPDADPKLRTKVGSYNGCHIDQVMGDSWARQVGLERIMPADHLQKALASLWRYNFAPDVGPYRAAHKQGRWYAMAGEAGLLMCTWPQGESMRVQSGYDYYFNECMNGFEYQVAGHMLWEGMVQEGMAVTRAIHDRYHAARRNPWNEVECGDHYARSMASYGVFLAACGYEYHGPKGHLGFAPRLTPEQFRAPFTAAEGWGTFEQRRDGATQRETIAVKWGQLRLRTLEFTTLAGLIITHIDVTINGIPLSLVHAVTDGQVQVTLAADVHLEAGQTLEVVLR